MAGSLKGRGAISSPAPRFDKHHSEAIDDGWYAEPPPDSIATTVLPEPARSIITRNDSPDIGFSQSINPYRGCEHGCVYCLSGDTAITMADGGVKPLAEIDIGDEIIGTAKRGHYRRYVRTRVLVRWRTAKPAWRIRLGDDTELIASGDHRFLTERGWKFVAAAASGQRPHLTSNNSLMGYGRIVASSAEIDTLGFRRGYLCGLTRPGRAHSDQHRFRLAMADFAPLDRATRFLADFGVGTQRFRFSPAIDERRPMEAIRTSAAASVAAIGRLIDWPDVADDDWQRGFVGGIFDAEGSFGNGVIRIANTDPQIIARLTGALSGFRFRTVLETPRPDSAKPVHYVRVRGGLRECVRFFRLFGPCIQRKRDIATSAVKSTARLDIVEIIPLGGVRELFDITTGTGDFIANGVVSHNCYARPSHAYMGLSPGLDFETKLFYKADAAARLTEELAKPRYVPSPIMLGANTDPYQPLEKRLRVTRSILEVLAKHRHPVSIVTKGALIERDLDILVPMARERLVGVMVSLTTLDSDLKRRLEPRAASAKARLAVIRRLAAEGVPVGTLIAPVIPGLTDHELERLLDAAAGAGARCAGYVVLRLPYEIKLLFREWLATHYPERANRVMSRVQAMRGGRDNDPDFGTRMKGTGADAALLRQRFQVAARRLALETRMGFQLDVTRFQPPQEDGPQMTLGP